MDKNSVEVGNRIFAARKSKGLSREKLAEMSEISVQFLSDIEKGRKSMTITTLRNICNSLNLSADYVINGTKQCEYGGIIALLNRLDEQDTKQAEKLLEVFVETLTDKKK